MARKVGYDCSDGIFKGILEDWKESDYKVHLSAEELEEFTNEFKEFLV